MAATDFIVAIELGSSKITGIAGKKHADGSIQVLALASENSSDFIRKGAIYNLDKTAQSLTSIIKKLESTLKASIGKVYVGIGGQSLRTIRNTEVRHLEEETKISQELIDSIMDSNRDLSLALLGPNGDMDFVERIETLIANRFLKQSSFPATDSEIRYAYAFCLSGCIGMIKTWLSRTEHESPEAMAELIYHLIDNTTQENIQNYIR